MIKFEKFFIQNILNYDSLFSALAEIFPEDHITLFRSGGQCQDLVSMTWTEGYFSLASSGNLNVVGSSLVRFRVHKITLLICSKTSNVVMSLVKMAYL